MASKNYNRESELKAFDDTKCGVKGLVDSGITKVPKIFINPEKDSRKTVNVQVQVEFPLIDLEGVDEEPIRRKAIVDGIREASETWGFFQVINHGIAGAITEEMIQGVRRFFQQDEEDRKKWYTRDTSKRVVHNSNFDLYRAPSANWRDTVFCKMAPHLPQSEELPAVCRDIMVEYTKQVSRVGKTLFEILSEGLGLHRDHLLNMKCSEGVAMLMHYYPECPEPELTLGASPHADSCFLTVLLNDQVNGLQVLYQNQWVNVPHTPGAIVVNIGDLLQLVSNDRFVSAQHRVVVNHVSPRVSVACFFRSSSMRDLYGPIDEVVGEDGRAKYRATTFEDYLTHFKSKGLDGTSALSNFRL